MNTIRIVAACLAVLATPAMAADITLPHDGWVSWQIEAVEGAPDFCCWSWEKGGPSRKTCALDDNGGNYGTRDKTTTTELARVYARTTAGKLDRVRVLSAACAVETRTPTHDLGSMPADDSARWLIALSKRGDAMNDDLRENVLAGLAMHRGSLAQDALAGIARGDGDREMRKKALFWLALLRGSVGAEITTAVMFNDKDPDVRQHASFAITQSQSPHMAQDLIRLGNTDKAGEVRAQAWFWLAQTGAPNAEEAIEAALRKDDDDHVREQAVFALSQLPDERATRALVAVAEDRSLSHEQRKRAVFWLAQSDSDAAQKYLDSVLARTSAH
jgi:hypothetical protein